MINTDTAAPILYESHMHTPLCNHATGQPEEYAAIAEQRGLKGIIVTCHNPTIDGWSPRVRMKLEEFDTYVAMVEHARQAWQDRVDVRLGMECDYVPGQEAWLRDLLSRAEFHHILGSVHPNIRDYRERYLNGDMIAFQKTYFEHLAMAAETGLFDTLSHPDLVKNIAPEQWHPEQILDTITQSLDRIAATGIAMELNTSGLNKAYSEMNPGLLILQEMNRRNIPVVLGADAHQPERVADRYPEALDLLKHVGYNTVSLFLNRQRQEFEINLVQATLTAKNGKNSA